MNCNGDVGLLAGGGVNTERIGSAFEPLKLDQVVEATFGLDKLDSVEAIRDDLAVSAHDERGFVWFEGIRRRIDWNFDFFAFENMNICALRPLVLVLRHDSPSFIKAINLSLRIHLLNVIQLAERNFSFRVSGQFLIAVGKVLVLHLNLYLLVRDWLTILSEYVDKIF